MEKSKENGNSQMGLFYESLVEALISPSEKIILKLKNLRNRAYFQNDVEAIQDFDWIISRFSNKDIYELEINEDIIDKNNEYLNNAFDYIISYSQIWDRLRKINDMQKILKRNSRTILKRNSRTMDGINLRILSKEGTINNADLSNLKDNEKDLISKFNIKLLPKEAQSLLKGVDDFDFSIFEVNKLLEKRTLPLIATTIFKNLEYLGTIINENTFYEFINAITDGYNRKITYHNVIIH